MEDVLFLENKNQEGNNNDGFETFGYKTENAAPQNEYLKPFENDLYNLLKNIEFRSPDFLRRQIKFQQKLKEDMNLINACPDVFVPADKTTNLYEVSKANY